MQFDAGLEVLFRRDLGGGRGLGRGEAGFDGAGVGRG